MGREEATDRQSCVCVSASWRARECVNVVSLSELLLQKKDEIQTLYTALHLKHNKAVGKSSARYKYKRPRRNTERERTVFLF